MRGIFSVILVESNLVTEIQKTYLWNDLRYLSFEDAMRVCSELGDLNSHLVPFAGPEEFEFFYEKSKVNPAVQRYCNHGDRKMFWLPYRNRCSTSFKEISVKNYFLPAEKTVSLIWPMWVRENVWKCKILGQNIIHKLKTEEIVLLPIWVN